MHLPTDYQTSLGRAARLLVLGLLIGLAGCVQKVPIAYYARPGDTIVLGLGGIQRNTSGAARLSNTDLTITLTNSATSATQTLYPDFMFKAFPDYSSVLTTNAIGQIYPTAHFVPFDGGWFVSVTLPDDGSLTPGAYKISITSPTHKLVNTKFTYGSLASEGDLDKIPLQIIDGTGGNPGYNQQFQWYPARSSLLDVSPNPAPDSAGLTTVGGAQLVITFPAASYDATMPIVALPYSHNPFISLQQNIVDNGDGTKSLIVLLSAQKGFVAAANQTALTPLLSDLSLSFTFLGAGSTPWSPTQQLADFKIDQSRSHYYDPSGNVIAALQPVMTFH